MNHPNIGLNWAERSVTQYGFLDSHRGNPTLPNTHKIRNFCQEIDFCRKVLGTFLTLKLGNLPELILAIKYFFRFADIRNQKTTSNTGQSVQAIDAKFNETFAFQKSKLHSMYKTK